MQRIGHRSDSGGIMGWISPAVIGLWISLVMIIASGAAIWMGDQRAQTIKEAVDHAIEERDKQFTVMQKDHRAIMEHLGMKLEPTKP